MAGLGLEQTIVDEAVYARTVERFRARKVLLPTFDQLAHPERIPDAITGALEAVDPDAAHPLNLFRVHWHNAADRRSRATVPEHVVLPEALTGVPAPIIVAYGNRFPMIRAHKVLAAYVCLVPRLVTGQFDPDAQRAIWPSTGNYCRGGVAISRSLGCRGVAVLPEEMSEERFRWLADWVSDPDDVIRTPGSESNVKEIYDRCAELARDERNVIFNQFCEFGNHLGHFLCTGTAMERVFLDEQMRTPGLELSAFVSATGSAGTIGAGDHLKEQFGSRIVAVEALECPTMLYNGFGAHNIQGIGDKHIPFIHNAMNTDLVVAISDESTDTLNALFNTDAGRAHLVEERGLTEELVRELSNFGLSSICNVLAAIRLARTLDLGPDQAVVTVATDGAAMYSSELDKARAKYFAGATGFDAAAAAQAFDEHLRAEPEHVMLCTDDDRARIFNLGYFTWVEQQGIELADFDKRKDQRFWTGLRDLVPIWDEMIARFNHDTGLGGG